MSRIRSEVPPIRRAARGKLIRSVSLVCSIGVLIFLAERSFFIDRLSDEEPVAQSTPVATASTPPSLDLIEGDDPNVLCSYIPVTAVDSDAAGPEGWTF